MMKRREQENVIKATVETKTGWISNGYRKREEGDEKQGTSSERYNFTAIARALL